MSLYRINFRYNEEAVSILNTIASPCRKNKRGVLHMKTQHIIKFIYAPFICMILLVLSACGSSDSGNTSGGRGNSLSVPGTITVGITDAAVDSAQEVWIQFTGVTIQPSNGNAINITFDSIKNINLLSLQGTLSTDLISNEVIPLGSYDWIRLQVNAENDSVNDSYIVLNDGSVHELWIPSGSQTGLKINSGFELLASEELNLMIDFDLRKSVVQSNGAYTLRPTLRMVNMKVSNAIMGTIDASQLIGPSCSDADPTTGNAVYLFEGTNTTPADMQNGNSGPLTSARVELNVSSGNYEYVFGFIPAGNYTLAFTCQADLDDPDVNNNIIFNVSENVTVVADRRIPLPIPAR